MEAQVKVKRGKVSSLEVGLGLLESRSPRVPTPCVKADPGLALATHMCAWGG